MLRKITLTLLKSPKKTNRHFGGSHNLKQRNNKGYSNEVQVTRHRLGVGFTTAIFMSFFTSSI